jgi:dolichol kinase
MLVFNICICIVVVLLAQALFTGCFGLLSTARTRDLPSRESPLHLKRKIQHFGSGLVLLAVDMSNLLSPFQEAGVLTLCAFVFWLAIHLTPRDLFVAIFKDILRTEEASGKVYPATLWFLLGCAALVLFFPLNPDVYRLGLLMLSAGDPVAGICGGLYGKTKWRVGGKKSAEGTLACAVVCSIVTTLYLFCTSNNFFWNGPTFDVFCLCLVAGIVGSIAELIPTPVDDNFSMPVLSAIGMWLVHYYVFAFSTSLPGEVEG